MGLEELRQLGLGLLGFAAAVVGVPALLGFVLKQIVDWENRQAAQPTVTDYLISLSDPNLRRN